MEIFINDKVFENIDINMGFSSWLNLTQVRHEIHATLPNWTCTRMFSIRNLKTNRTLRSQVKSLIHVCSTWQSQEERALKRHRGHRILRGVTLWAVQFPRCHIHPTSSCPWHSMCSLSMDSLKKKKVVFCCWFKRRSVRILHWKFQNV